MGKYVDSDFGYDTFKQLYRETYFVDKSNIFHELNKVLSGNGYGDNIFVSKPRRFGKTSMAAMVIAYYSKGRRRDEFKKIFDSLNISKVENFTPTFLTKWDTSNLSKEKNIYPGGKKTEYEKTQGQYHTIYINFSEDIKDFKRDENDRMYHYLDSIGKRVIDELKSIYKECAIDTDCLETYLRKLNKKTNESFIFVMDDWDFIFNHDEYTNDEKYDYLCYIKNLISYHPYVALTFMTGLLYENVLRLYDVESYSLANDHYFGFTEGEVRALCQKNKKLRYEDMEKWYNGYLNKKGEKMFYPWSVKSALINNKIRNYLEEETELVQEIKDIIKLDVHLVYDDLLTLVLGEKIIVDFVKDTEKTSIEEMFNEYAKKSIYSSLIKRGFLVRNKKQNRVYIPNTELIGLFQKVIDQLKGLKGFCHLIRASKKLLKATLNKDTKSVCEILKEIHTDTNETGMGNYYNNHSSLCSKMESAYIAAMSSYHTELVREIKQKLIHLIFYPEEPCNGTAIVLEFTVGKTAVKDTPIKQIYRQQYYRRVRKRGCEGKVLLVGINVVSLPNIEYTCAIEEYDEKNGYKRKNNNEKDDNGDDNNNHDDNSNKQNKKKRRKRIQCHHHLKD
ncbi:hypothetical protein PIROE2DRAFT_64858 [Piromyces sp. E2]|nr:hypothetical protein PIROE2DRAFT_64858 [Piromyces sp. E2]|eukprot:OUM57688.1 hypothetical protein PIROE2DRAFT_64858 [Piromyces sp. E2]